MKKSGIISLGARIAVRYLFGRKSHSAVNAIASVSLCGIAVATAAIICVLSVFNGFKDVLGNKLDSFTPDIEVSRKDGKVFDHSDRLIEQLKGIREIKIAQPVLNEQALALVGTRELPIVLRGVEPAKYVSATRMDTLFFEGSEPLRAPQYAEQASPASIAVGTAVQLQTGQPGSRITIFAPRRKGRINLANPAASFTIDSVEVTSVYRSGQKEFDDNVVITDISRVRELLQHSASSASSLDIMLTPRANPKDIKSKISSAVGADYRIRTREELHQTSFRMVEIEKYITFLLLVFILLIASFNIISTLCMLVIEKEGSISTLRALGMSKRRVGRIFEWESWLVTLTGGVAGLILGSLLCLAQQYFGFIKLNGDADSLIMSSYPVKLQASDMLVTLMPIVVIGLICALTAGAYARNRAK